ncbi:HAD family hydrolase [Oceanomicrobium pacificus]|uniref:HAD hydrolase-like protein n=1 Tax=Oceanomicrobium pacificus TaxID=2692916 RepID=A0A6B0TTU2_9RHOB|nr:HAD family hydrolase [Oceanomicrobium pacificus]MXU65215.1 HAD hydrolase-like protein [Oceanomicrobium pacificus]
MAVRLVVFDLDDTLYLERDHVLSGFDHLERLCREALGVEGFGTACRDSFLADPNAPAIDRAVVRTGIGPALEAAGIDPVAELRGHRPKIALCPDAKNLLGILPAHVPTGIVTDGRLVTQNLKIDALGLRERISTVHINDPSRGGHFKPDTPAFADLQADFGVTGEACIYIGDNPAKDFIGPRRLGWTTVQVERSARLHHTAPPTPAHAADLTVARLDAPELLSILP